MLLELARERDRLSRLEDMLMDGDISKERYRLRRAEIDMNITYLEDSLYAANRLEQFKPVLRRLTSTLSRLYSSTVETKKTLINSVIERLDIGSGQVLHLSPRPWTKSFF